jgi:hypothetical protein
MPSLAPEDRLMTVSLKFTGYYLAAGDPRLNQPNGVSLQPGYYGSAVYTQVSTTPDMPNAMTSTGAISLPGVDPQSGYTDNCDITFVLDPTSGVVLQGASPSDPLSPVAWAKDLSTNLLTSAMICGTLVENPPGSGNYTITPNPNMSVAWSNGVQSNIMLDDDDNSGNNYYYRPAIIIPAAGDYYISLDPPITIKPGRPG